MVMSDQKVKKVSKVLKVTVVMTEFPEKRDLLVNQLQPVLMRRSVQKVCPVNVVESENLVIRETKVMLVQPVLWETLVQSDHQDLLVRRDHKVNQAVLFCKTEDQTKLCPPKNTWKLFELLFKNGCRRKKTEKF